MEPLIGFAQGQKPQAAEDPVSDSSGANFGRDVIEPSMQTPIIVDFWAPWCEPCKQLTPALEGAVRKARGKVKLVKINVDENQMLVQQLRIQSIPTVFAFFGGRPVDAFQGALPESQIKSFIQKQLAAAGKDADDPIAGVLEQAKAALEDGDEHRAKAIYAQILDADPSNIQAHAGLIRCLIAEGLTDQAHRMLDSLPPDLAKEQEIQSVRSALELADQARGANGEIGGLRAKVDAAPDDHQARFDLALALYGAGENAEAVDALVEIVRRDREWREGAARKQLLKLFEAFGPTDPVTAEGRRKLSSILFS